MERPSSTGIGKTIFVDGETSTGTKGAVSMARPKVEDTREIRESVADGEEMSREQMAGWLLQWITGGDIRGYAERIRERYNEAMKAKEA